MGDICSLPPPSSSPSTSIYHCPIWRHERQRRQRSQDLSSCCAPQRGHPSRQMREKGPAGGEGWMDATDPGHPQPVVTSLSTHPFPWSSFDVVRKVQGTRVSVKVPLSEGNGRRTSPVNTEMAGQEAQQPPPLPCLPSCPDSNYSVTCQLENNRSRILHLSGWWGYFCWLFSKIISFQISAGFNLFIHSLAVAFVPAWHFVMMQLSKWVCIFAHFVQACCQYYSTLVNKTAYCHSHICPMIGSDFGLNLSVPLCL